MLNHQPESGNAAPLPKRLAFCKTFWLRRACKRSVPSPLLSQEEVNDLFEPQANPMGAMGE